MGDHFIQNAEVPDKIFLSFGFISISYEHNWAYE